MSNWFVQASKTYQLELNGKLVSLSSDQITHLIKKKLKNSKIVRKLFDRFGISLNQLDNLDIEITPLEGRHASTDAAKMRIDESLFKNGTDFFAKWSFLPMHEIVHFLYRVREDQSYFNDPEEVLGFVAAIADSLEDGQTVQEIWKNIFPRIRWHFGENDDAKSFFKKCIHKAKQLTGE